MRHGYYRAGSGSAGTSIYKQFEMSSRKNKDDTFVQKNGIIAKGMNLREVCATHQTSNDCFLQANITAHCRDGETGSAAATYLCATDNSKTEGSSNTKHRRNS